MNNRTGTISKKADSPEYDKNNCDDVKKISHDFIFYIVKLLIMINNSCEILRIYSEVDSTRA